ncbi:ribonuclease HII [Patescibacteria group bacterium]|nr:MAG: ribonuclease HII [Patescibacteria group bacterium]
MAKICLRSILFCMLGLNSRNNKKFRYVVGIDEVGRGPIAGPVVVGALCVDMEHAKAQLSRAEFRQLFSGIKDSKKLSPEQREKWFVHICSAREAGVLDFAVTFVSAKDIDTKGLAPSIRKALQKSLQKVAPNPENTQVLLDGSLYAPVKYKNQKTIIKGDLKEPIIGLASIVAKVSRDRLMVSYAKNYAQYDFEVHKGYGTRKHYEKIKKHGLSPLHRKSFLRKLVK